MTEFSFSIQTPNREYILSCDSHDDRESWVESIQTVLVKNSSEPSNSPLVQYCSQIKRFTNKYQISRRDPHSIWVLQWWFPICIEILSRFYIKRKQEFFKELDEFFVRQSHLAMFLLSGEFVYDRKFVRGFEGIVRASHDTPDVKEFLLHRISIMKSNLHCMFENFKSTSISIYDLVSLWNAKVKDDPTIATHQEMNSHKYNSAVRSLFFFYPVPEERNSFSSAILCFQLIFPIS